MQTAPTTSPKTDLSDVTLEGAPGGARKEEAGQVDAAAVGRTPTPWTLLEPKRAGGELGCMSDRGIFASGMLIGEMWTECPDASGGKHIADASANAAFAVRAVNSHDALVAIAQEVAVLGPGKCSLGKQFVINAIAALKLADGQE